MNFIDYFAYPMPSTKQKKKWAKKLISYWNQTVSEIEIDCGNFIAHKWNTHREEKID